MGEPSGQPRASIARKPNTGLAGIGRRSPEPFDKLRAGSAEGAPSSCWAATQFYALRNDKRWCHTSLADLPIQIR